MIKFRDGATRPGSHYKSRRGTPNRRFLKYNAPASRRAVFPAFLSRGHPIRSCEGVYVSQPNPALSSEGVFVSQPNIDQLCINTIRTLSIDAVQHANSGHPGAPMGLAPVVYSLWQSFLRYDPADPLWPNRDRFVLSAGHASMLLYSTLHLAGVRAVNAKGEVQKELSVSMDE